MQIEVISITCGCIYDLDLEEFQIRFGRPRLILISNDEVNIMNSIIKKVRETISTFDMIHRNDRVLACVSGGPDSVALLDLLIGVASEFSIKIGIAHLNHSLRSHESDKDAKFVETLAKNYGLSVHLEKKNILDYRDQRKLSIEESARQVRYQFFNRVADKHGYDKVALGHHGDDNAELVLMNLLRGSGPLGLSGIPPVREGRVIRPLIFLTKIEIMDYLKSKDIDFVTDQSNKDNRFTRNKIRNHLLPLVQQSYNPGIRQNLRQYADILRTEEEWLDGLLKPVYQEMIMHSGQEHITLSLSKLNRCHLAEKRRILRYAVKAVKGNLRRISFSHIDSMIKLIIDQTNQGHLDLPNSIKIKYNRDEVTILNEKKRPAQRFQKSTISKRIIFNYPVTKPGLKIESIRIRETGIRIQLNQIDEKEIPDFKASGTHVEFFNMDRLNFPLILRNVEPGDRFVPFGMSGRQKVKKFFINNKVSKDMRWKSPVLLNNDDIIWVVGFRRAEYAKVTPATRNILKIELLLA